MFAAIRRQLVIPTKLGFLILVIAFLPSPLCAQNSTSKKTTRLATIQHAPPFQLTSHDNKEVKLADLHEKVLVVSFVFTTCNGSCPATTHRLAKVQEALKQRRLLQKGQVRFLSITLDPKRDTPAALKRYLDLYEIDETHWSFLTGKPATVQKVITAWGMWVKPAANGQLDHPSRIFLVDGKRRVREIYNLGFMRTQWVVDDIVALLEEK